MRAEDLDLKELLDWEPEGGLMRLAGQRALLLDAMALGLLRKELIDLMGLTAAKSVLMRFGYFHGMRMAERLRTLFQWDSPFDLAKAGARLHALQGLLVLLPVHHPCENLQSTWVGPHEAVWAESYEAEQHLLHLGRAEVPVCWTLAGFGSGFISAALGQEILLIEQTCVGRGDAACRVIGKPLAEWGEEGLDLGRALRERCLEGPLQKLAEELKTTERRLRQRKQELVRVTGDGNAEDSSGLSVRSESMRKVVELARRVAKVETTVLLTGESGVGKERLARLVHETSSRASGPFLAVNCGALTESLLESELFGHAHGAFTGATQDRPGLFEAASGGTLFLDEIGEVSPAMQVKLLRTLQEREVRRVGENRSRKVNVRIIAATNRDLAEEVDAGHFRKDLLYRLKVVELKIPALRERPEDLLPLARIFLADAARRMDRTMEGLTPEVADTLSRYDWPGNVRELENAMERAAALAEGHRVVLEDLPEEVRQAPLKPALGESIRPLEEIERDYVLAALDRNGGNQTRTAEQLGIGTATLYRKLKSWRTEARGQLRVVNRIETPRRIH